MEATVLNRALSTVSAAVNPKTKLAILTHVLLEQHPAGLRLVASDLEMTVVYQLPPNGNADTGSLTAPVTTFAKLAKTLKGEVTLTLEPATLTTRLQAGDGDLRLTLHGYQAADFLAPPERPATACSLATVEAATLQDALKRVLPAIAADEKHPALNSVRLAVTAGSAALPVQGANGFTLHTLAVPLAAPAGITADVLLGLKQLQQLLKALSESAAQTVQLYADPKQEPAPEQKAPPRLLYVEWDNADGAQVRAHARLTNEPYPDLERVIPTGPVQQTLTVSAKALLAALKKVRVVEPYMVALETAGSAALEISAITYDNTELTTSVPCTWTGVAWGTLVNPAYLETNLKAMPDDAVTVEFRCQTLDDGTVDTCQAIVVRSGALLAVTMPMHRGKGGGCRWSR